MRRALPLGLTVRKTPLQAESTFDSVSRTAVDAVTIPFTRPPNSRRLVGTDQRAHLALVVEIVRRFSPWPDCSRHAHKARCLQAPPQRQTVRLVDNDTTNNGMTPLPLLQQLTSPRRRSLGEGGSRNHPSLRARRQVGRRLATQPQRTPQTPPSAPHRIAPDEHHARGARLALAIRAADRLQDHMHRLNTSRQGCPSRR